MIENQTNQRRLTLLFTCVGRRVELLQSFRAAARRLNIALTLVGTDHSKTAPAMDCVDRAVIVPAIEDPAYVESVCAAISAHTADALIPTIDNDLVLLSQNRERFASLGCRPLISDPTVINLCRDKIAMAAFLTKNGVDTPVTRPAHEVLTQTAHTFPYFIKPRFGFAGLWAQKAADPVDLQFYSTRIEEPIVQEFVTGQEYTLDVYAGLNGKVRCVVPRARWQVRSGEVIKGVVVRDLEIMNAAKRVVELLGPSVCSILTLQCIVTPQRRIRFIEINPRFGGGAPLSIASGADFPAWLMQEMLGESPAIAFDGFRHGLCMLRYDWSAFVQLDEDLKPQIRKPIRAYPPFE